MLTVTFSCVYHMGLSVLNLSDEYSLLLNSQSILLSVFSYDTTVAQYSVAFIFIKYDQILNL